MEMQYLNFLESCSIIIDTNVSNKLKLENLNNAIDYENANKFKRFKRFREGSKNTRLLK